MRRRTVPVQPVGLQSTNGQGCGCDWSSICNGCFTPCALFSCLGDQLDAVGQVRGRQQDGLAGQLSPDLVFRVRQGVWPNVTARPCLVTHSYFCNCSTQATTQALAMHCNHLSPTFSSPPSLPSFSFSGFGGTPPSGAMGMPPMGGPMGAPPKAAAAVPPPPAPPPGKPPGAAAGASGSGAAAVSKRGAGGKAGEKEKDGKGKLREAAGTRWWDPTLGEWPENDFRVSTCALGACKGTCAWGLALHGGGVLASVGVCIEARCACKFGTCLHLHGPWNV